VAIAIYSGADSTPMAEERRYKDSRIYGCFVLNRLISEMGIDITQPGLEERLDELLAERARPLSKEDIKHEIKSNHYMVEKVISSLESEGLVRVEKDDVRYKIYITREGVLHARKFNAFYNELYREQIREHYRFRKMPYWFDDQ
jgi:predicted transcriptional regulator